MKFLALLLEELKGQKAKRAEYLKKTYEGRWQGVEGYEDLDSLITAIAETDPTQKGIYMQWILTKILKDPQRNRPEDLPRLKKDLEAFEEHKAKLPNKDINAYKEFSDVYGAIEPLTKPKNLTAAQKRAATRQRKLEAARSDVTDVYNGAEGWIKIPNTQAAACHLGQNTRWCTAARSNNMYDHYAKTDKLFVIYDKETRQRFQLHIDTGQFSDVTDKMIGMDQIPQWARPHIINWYKKNAKTLNMRQAMTFVTLGDKDAAKGTPHEELVDLMKQYGVV